MNINVTNNATGESKSPEFLQNIFPVSPDTLTLVATVLGLAVTSIRYAVWLNTPLGRKWDQQHTWFVTVIGVMMTLAWLAVHDPKAAIKAFAFFIVSGMPIVVRALALETANLDTLISRESR